MKIPKGMTIYAGGKKYIKTIPDSVLNDGIRKKIEKATGEKPLKKTEKNDNKHIKSDGKTS